jgi:hypothetical protein
MPVTLGSFSGGHTVYGNDCLLPQGTYYKVLVQDTNGNNIMSDNWVVTGSIVDVGTIVSAVISGTTATLGQPAVVITQPTVTQTVTQPPSTVLAVNALSVTSSFLFPDGSGCNTTACSFNGLAAFLNGLGTNPSSSSALYIGASGVFVLRTITGSDFSCGGQPDGWTGVRVDTKELQICIAGVTRKIGLL